MTDLFYERKKVSEKMTKHDRDNAFRFAEGYKEFIDKGKLERLCVKYAVSEAEKKGFRPFEYGKEYKPGDKIYLVQKEKAAVFAIIGTNPLDEGFDIVAAHVDNPRLDIKGMPLYEDTGFAYMRTHYYGGIKKYQWTTIPLMLTGVVYKKDGTQIEISIGNEKEDPVFCVTDLLVHLSYEQAKKPLGEAFNGEMLNILIGSEPDPDAEKDKIKTNILKLIKDKYGISEEDFLSADLSAVPAEKSRDLGFDKSMILGFGHDDRSCAYPAFKALMDKQSVRRTAVCVFADREEVGSMGITGLRSNYMTDFLIELCENSHVNVRKAFANSKALSADVSAAVDPSFPEVFEKQNNALLGCGIAFNKFTGRGGKAGASEAGGKFIASILNELDKNSVIYQFAEMGRIDAGGGGTVSQFLADRNIEVIDVGVPVISMHAPYEVISKNDLYMLYKCCETFYK